MKETILLLVWCVLLSPIYSDVFIELADPDDNLIDECRSKSYDLGKMTLGQKKQVPGHCMTATCGKDQNIYYTGCGVVAGSAECKKIDIDLTKPHPECCPRIECP